MGKKVPTFLIFVYKITVVQRLKIFYFSWLFVSWNSVFSYFKFLIYQNNPFSNKSEKPLWGMELQEKEAQND